MCFADHSRQIYCQAGTKFIVIQLLLNQIRSFYTAAMLRKPKDSTFCLSEV